MASRPRSLLDTPVEKTLPLDSPWLPWGCFGVMVLANSLLSYFRLSLSAGLWVLLAGILLPFFALALAARAKAKKGPTRESLPPIPSWVWIALALLSIGLRFFRLATLSGWPVVDEGNFGYFATLLGEKWGWNLTFGFAQEPALYIWGQSLCFKMLGNSLFSLWLFPALCSVLCVPLVFLAAGKVFGRFVGFFAACWMGLGFWPLYMGRFSTPCVLMLLWECLAFLVLAAYFTPGRPSKTFTLLLLAAVAGSGFYIYLAWLPVAAVLALALAFHPSLPAQKRFKPALLFGFGAFVLALPLVLTLTRNYLGYLNHLWPTGASASLQSRLNMGLSYFQALFWSKGPEAFSFGPLWGGLLNPLTASLFFMGMASLLSSYRRPLHLFLLGSGLLFFLPGILTNNFEVMRLAALLPLLAVVAALGAESLLSPFPQSQKIFLLAPVLLASLALDLRHLFIVYPSYGALHPSFYGAQKTPEFGKAYPLLESAARSQGPGLVLLNFHPDPYDQTLFVAAHSFNAAENNRLDPSKAGWMALVANIHEQPYLQKLFPQGRWVWLSEGLGRPDGGLLLEITPVNQANRELVLKWVLADQSLKELTRRVMEWGVDPDQSQMLGTLEKAYPFFKGDRLLESRFWRIWAIHQIAAGRREDAIEGEEKAIGLGYPMAQLFNEWGCLLYGDQRPAEARKAFERALRLKPNCTDAEENLQNLGPAGKPRR